MDCSVKIVIYAKNSDQKKYLLAKNEEGWGLVRGVTDRKTQPYTAGINAVKQGAGITSFKKYEYLGEMNHSGGRGWDDVFSMFVEKQECKPGNGYSRQDWFSYEEALSKLSRNDKKALEIVESKTL